MVEKLTDPSPITEKTQPDLRAYAKACHYVEDDCEYNRFLREVALELVRRELRSLSTVEQDVLQMIEALDDMDKSINLLDERLYEWSLLHRDDIARTKDLPLSLAGQGLVGELATAIIDLRRSRQRIEEGLSMSISTIAPNHVRAGRSTAGGQADVASRESQPSIGAALQHNPDHGGGESTIQAPQREGSLSQARADLQTSGNNERPKAS